LFDLVDTAVNWSLHCRIDRRAESRRTDRANLRGKDAIALQAENPGPSRNEEQRTWLTSLVNEQTFMGIVIVGASTE
jgi:hypothetical protein